MSIFAVGDVQGCYTPLRRLLDAAAFDPDRHVLWLVGDLVNRGPESLATLRFVKSLGDAAVSVLGNHDLHLLAMVYGGHPVRRSDTLAEVLDAPDVGELAEWLCTLPLLVRDSAHATVMVHAGLPHLWSPPRAAALAEEVSAAIRGADRGAYFEAMYGNVPARWDDGLEGLDRLRCITNYFTRMRLVAEDGTLDFTHKKGLDNLPPGFEPWYLRRHPDSSETRILFGHWAALDGRPTLDAVADPKLLALDTGCVWGRCLTGIWLQSGARHTAQCGALA